MARFRALALLAALLAAGLAFSARAAAVGFAEDYFGTHPEHHARRTALVYEPPRPGAPPELRWRVAFRPRGELAARLPGVVVDTVSEFGVYFTPLGRPVAAFPSDMIR